MTQKEMIVEYIKANGSITDKEAMDALGVMRLGSRIHDLRMDGVIIRSELETTKNRFGKKTTYCRYFMGA